MPRRALHLQRHRPPTKAALSARCIAPRQSKQIQTKTRDWHRPRADRDASDAELPATTAVMATADTPTGMPSSKIPFKSITFTLFVDLSSLKLHSPNSATFIQTLFARREMSMKPTDGFFSGICFFSGPNCLNLDITTIIIIETGGRIMGGRISTEIRTTPLATATGTTSRNIDSRTTGELKLLVSATELLPWKIRIS